MHLHLRGSQTSDRCPLALFWAACSPMYRHVLELEALFERPRRVFWRTSPTPSPSSGCSTSSVFWLSHYLPPCSWPKGKWETSSCLISLLPMLSHLTPVGLLFKSLTSHSCGLAATLTSLSLMTSSPCPPLSTHTLRTACSSRSATDQAAT